MLATRLARAPTAASRIKTWLGASADVIRSAWAIRRSQYNNEPGNQAAPGGGTPQRGGGGRMDHWIQDLRHTVRHLTRSPGFTTGATLLLAVGLGANIAVFSLVDAVLFRPPPWVQPEEVVYVYQDSDDGEPSSSSFPAYRDMTSESVFAHVAATSPSGATLERNGAPVPVDTEFTTASMMNVMGLTPARGRWFDPEHDQVGSEMVAVVSHPTWTSTFGADPGLVGSTVRLNGQPVTVIGVGPEGLGSSFPPFMTDFWLSISTTPIEGEFRVTNLERRSDHWYQIRARLAPGVGVTQASSAMDGLADRLARDYPDFNRGRGITVFQASDVRATPGQDGRLFQMGTLLMAVVATVLLLACANLANLLLARGLARSGEMAVRRAMGAGGGRVARLFFMESTALAAIGGGLGLLISAWVLRAFPSTPLAGFFPGAMDLRSDLRVMAYALALVLLTGALFGLVPALRAARRDVAGPLRDDGRGASLGKGGRRLRNALVATQVAASLVFVVVTGLLARSLAAVQGAETGVDEERIAWVRTGIGTVAEGGEERLVLIQEIIDRIEALPGVEMAAVTSRLPAQRGGSTTTVVEGYTPSAGTEAVELPFLVVSDDYFDVMGMRVVEGRGFGPDEVEGGETHVLVNETAARVFWGGTDVVGRRMRGQGSDRWRSVIGVVSDAPVGGLAEDVTPAFYYSQRQTGGMGSFFLVARTPQDPADALSAIRQRTQETRGGITIDGQGTLVDHFGEGLAASRFTAGLLGGFSFLALALAGLGVYAVISFGVARRSAELGLRMALGAGSRQVTFSVVRDVLGTVMTGLAIGLVLSLLAAPRITSLMYGVDGRDPLAIWGSVGIITAVAALAAWAPARRAARADPVEALRVS